MGCHNRMASYLFFLFSDADTDSPIFRKVNPVILIKSQKRKTNRLMSSMSIYLLYFSNLTICSWSSQVDVKTARAKVQKRNGGQFGACFLRFFIRKPLKVINLWGYWVLVQRKMLNFANQI